MNSVILWQNKIISFHIHKDFVFQNLFVDWVVLTYFHEFSKEGEHIQQIIGHKS